MIIKNLANAIFSAAKALFNQATWSESLSNFEDAGAFATITLATIPMLILPSIYDCCDEKNELKKMSCSIADLTFVQLLEEAIKSS